MPTISPFATLTTTSSVSCLLAGPMHERKIRAVLMQKDFVFTAAGTLIHAWKRGKPVRTSSVPCLGPNG